ncbi:MAG: peptidoglycan DD-metalloendopeptidase family protein [Rhodospirillales bacterium]
MVANLYRAVISATGPALSRFSVSAPVFAGVLAGLLAIQGFPAPAQAQAQEGAGNGKIPQLGLPIRCQPGRDCWLVNYVDVDPGPGIRDYACGGRTYDGHKGTDIAIRDLKAMELGVPVLAAAGGVVRSTRDGMKDVDFTQKNAPAIKDRECGNGVLLVHDDGWETQYCHMRRGSVAVRTGDSVKRGQEIGLVGHSGRPRFPHVHMSVRLNKQIVDPFAGPGRKKKCGLGPLSLWRKSALAALGGETTALYNAGFSAKRPEPRAVRAGLLGGGRLSPKAPALVLWVDMFWVEAGDKVTFRIFDPQGKVLVRRSFSITKTQARRFVFVGKKRKLKMWPAGTYRGKITLVRERKGKTLTLKAERTVDVR